MANNETQFQAPSRHNRLTTLISDGFFLRERELLLEANIERERKMIVAIEKHAVC